DVLPKMVREFYAHLTFPNNGFIYARVVSLWFDEDSINAHYNLPEGLNEHSEFMSKITTKGYNKFFKIFVLRELIYLITIVILLIELP
ncbi:hypothetical protein J1N35_001166, partial [Gossypium stocksii]